MAKRGYMRISGPDGGGMEADVVTCSHCRKVIPVKPDQGRSYMRLDLCRQCMGHMCRGCAAQLRCEPFEKRLEAIERREALRRKAGV